MDAEMADELPRAKATKQAKRKKRNQKKRKSASGTTAPSVADQEVVASPATAAAPTPGKKRARSELAAAVDPAAAEGLSSKKKKKRSKKGKKARSAKKAMQEEAGGPAASPPAASPPAAREAAAASPLDPESVPTGGRSKSEKKAKSTKKKKKRKRKKARKMSFDSPTVGRVPSEPLPAEQDAEMEDEEEHHRGPVEVDDEDAQASPAEKADDEDMVDEEELVGKEEEPAEPQSREKKRKRKKKAKKKAGAKRKSAKKAAAPPVEEEEEDDDDDDDDDVEEAAAAEEEEEEAAAEEEEDDDEEAAEEKEEDDEEAAEEEGEEEEEEEAAAEEEDVDEEAAEEEEEEDVEEAKPVRQKRKKNKNEAKTKAVVKPNKQRASKAKVAAPAEEEAEEEGPTEPAAKKKARSKGKSAKKAKPVAAAAAAGIDDAPIADGDTANGALLAKAYTPPDNEEAQPRRGIWARVKGLPLGADGGYHHKWAEIKDPSWRDTFLSVRWTSDEDERLRRIYRNYARSVWGLDDDHLLDPITERKGPRRRGFWLGLARAFKFRTVKAVFDRATRLLHPDNYQGTWTDKQKKDLRRAVALYHDDWAKIGEMVGRYPRECATIWNRSKDANTRSGAWTEEEKKKLAEAVESQRSAGNGVNWAAVAKAVGTRSLQQCCTRWFNAKSILKRADKKWDVRSDLKMVTAAIDCGALAWSEIDWPALAEESGLPEGACRQRLKVMARHLRRPGVGLDQVFEQLAAKLEQKLAGARQQPAAAGEDEDELDLLPSDGD